MFVGFASIARIAASTRATTVQFRFQPHNALTCKSASARQSADARGNSDEKVNKKRLHPVSLPSKTVSL